MAVALYIPRFGGAFDFADAATRLTDIAARAGAAIMDHFGRTAEVKLKHDSSPVTLADKVAASPDNLPRAFEAYQQDRYLRTGRVQIMARVYGEFYHARGVAAELRDLALSNRTPQQSYDGIAWLYGGP